MADEAVAPEEGVDPTEAIRLAILALGIAINVALLYYSMKDTAEMIALRARLGAWATKLRRPLEVRRLMRKATGKVLWDATQIVEGEQ